MLYIIYIRGNELRELRPMPTKIIREATGAVLDRIIDKNYDVMAGGIMNIGIFVSLGASFFLSLWYSLPEVLQYLG